MSIRSVIKMGNKQLATPSSPVNDFATESLNQLILDMEDTMEKNGGVGIAAPQIGCNLQVIIFGFEQSMRYPDEEPVPFTVLINPTITILSDETIDGWEGCLSVPGLRGLVPRYKKIQYHAFDREGNPISKKVEGFHARIIQHEYDHLQGILYPQRIKDLKFFGFEDELSFYDK